MKCFTNELENRSNYKCIKMHIKGRLRCERNDAVDDAVGKWSKRYAEYITFVIISSLEVEVEVEERIFYSECILVFFITFQFRLSESIHNYNIIIT